MPPRDKRLKITNMSNENIYFYYSCDTVLNELHIFRNGTYSNKREGSYYVLSDLYVKSKSSVNVFSDYIGHDGWPIYLSRCKSKTLNIFIFSESMVNKYSDDSLRVNKLYIKRMSFTIKELEKNNWVVYVTIKPLSQNRNSLSE